MFINILLFLLALLGACQSKDEKNLTLVVDTKCDTAGLPERYRRDDILRASGSGQFYEDGLAHIIRNVAPRKLVVIDLRQESHGFVNGIPITWFGKRNWANKGKTLEEVEQDETMRLDAIKKLKKVDSISIRTVMSEKTLCKDLHVDYTRIPVQDNCKPAESEVNRFIARMKSLPNNTWVHFHCYAGMGRTTLFLVMLDMMQHAKHDSFDEIIMRQKTLGGIDLRKDVKASHKVARCIEERKMFIAQFYEYCKTNNDNFKTPFMS